MSVELLLIGVIFGFILSSVLFIQKIWREEDKRVEWESRAKFYKREYLKAMQGPEEITVNMKPEDKEKFIRQCNSSDLFGKF